MFIREVLFLFILCGLFFIILFLLYMRVQELRKENEALKDIIAKYISHAKKGEEREKSSGEEPLRLYSGDTNCEVDSNPDSD